MVNLIRRIATIIAAVALGTKYLGSNPELESTVFPETIRGAISNQRSTLFLTLRTVGSLDLVPGLKILSVLFTPRTKSVGSHRLWSSLSKATLSTNLAVVLKGLLRQVAMAEAAFHPYTVKVSN